MQDARLFPMLTVYETLLFAADFRLRPIPMTDKRQRVEKLIEQLGLSLGVEALAAFALTGMKPPTLRENEMSIVPLSPSHASNRRLHLQTNAKKDQDFDHSLRSPWSSSKSWSASHSRVLQTLGFSPSRKRRDHRNPNPIR
ncbi:hypothetical protein K7X08_014012 [Anisodus acutangulus]|uniref:Uncharacterized protein n=1 Tax=Anisodus acutangulus TaxID=402998 RepID=A0A9Q1LL64_9SOLA|nr:hypothetical protein K7X08_014012 [Anisodus acutangulus]